MNKLEAYAYHFYYHFIFGFRIQARRVLSKEIDVFGRIKAEK